MGLKSLPCEFWLFSQGLAMQITDYEIQKIKNENSHLA